MRTRISLLLAVPALALAGTGYTQYCWTEGTRRLEVNVRGAVEFSDDDRDVKSLSSGGYFQVEESRLLVFTGRRYEVTADSSGRLSRMYYDHGHATSLDNQGQAWLMGVMPEVIRRTGLGAAPRIQRISETKRSDRGLIGNHPNPRRQRQANLSRGIDQAGKSKH